MFPNRIDLEDKKAGCKSLSYGAQKIGILWDIEIVGYVSVERFLLISEPRKSSQTYSRQGATASCRSGFDRAGETVRWGL